MFKYTVIFTIVIIKSEEYSFNTILMSLSSLHLQHTSHHHHYKSSSSLQVIIITTSSSSLQVCWHSQCHHHYKCVDTLTMSSSLQVCWHAHIVIIITSVLTRSQCHHHYKCVDTPTMSSSLQVCWHAHNVIIITSVLTHSQCHLIPMILHSQCVHHHYLVLWTNQWDQWCLSLAVSIHWMIFMLHHAACVYGMSHFVLPMN